MSRRNPPISSRTVAVPMWVTVIFMVVVLLVGACPGAPGMPGVGAARGRAVPGTGAGGRGSGIGCQAGAEIRKRSR
ncbi:hypothetical protein GCM10025734_67560 [Kitasatospora paranensis]